MKNLLFTLTLIVSLTTVCFAAPYKRQHTHNPWNHAGRPTPTGRSGHHQFYPHVRVYPHHHHYMPYRGYYPYIPYRPYYYPVLPYPFSCYRIF